MSRGTKRTTLGIGFLLCAAASCGLPKSPVGGSGAGGGSATANKMAFTLSDCEVGDPDRPVAGNGECGIWACSFPGDAPGAFARKLHCEKKQPRMPHPTGSYPCRPIDSGDICPRGKTSNSVPIPSGAWSCAADATTLSCDLTGTPGTNVTTMGDWTCVTAADGMISCSHLNCFLTAAGEFGCGPGLTGAKPIPPTTTPMPIPPPTGGPPLKWNCSILPGGADANMGALVCTSTLPGSSGGGNLGPGGSSGGLNSPFCTLVGKERWCDGHTYCAWGKQRCDENGTWGACIEGDPNAASSVGPNTADACYFSGSYNPQVCEDPKTCIIQGQRTLPCPPNAVLPAGSLCAPCRSDVDCPGAACISRLYYERDTPAGGAWFQVVEHYCSTPCDANAAVPRGYACIRPADAPVGYLIPVNSAHKPRRCLPMLQ
jgi:hypothetical protein